jgi:DNA-binding transcriptional ArsR family regulator
VVRPRTVSRSVQNASVDEVSLQQLLEALVDPVRRSVVRQLADRGQDMSCGTFELPISRSTSSHHFNVLREAGLISQYYIGTTKMNSLRRDEIEQRFPGVLDSLLAAAD